MGAYDQAARFAAQADHDAVVRRVLRPTKLDLPFREWLDTRTVPPPGGPDRIADLIAALDRPSGEPVLLVLEFQSEHDPEKLDVTLEETGTLRTRVRHGEERRGKYGVLPALIYLRGKCPDPILDMTLPGGYGTLHRPLVWEVEADDAAEVVASVERGETSWGMLFWVPLMAGAAEPALIARWRARVEGVSSRGLRHNLVGIALVFSELSRRRVEWGHGLEGFEMTESEVVNGWIRRGMAEGVLEGRRRTLLQILNRRFPGAVPAEVTRLISEQESMDLLSHWTDAAVDAYTFQQFLDVLKQ